MVIPYAKALFRSEKYQDCINLLNKVNVLPFEGASGGRKLYRNAHILSAIQNINNKKYRKALEHLSNAKQWPENLGAGKPYNSDQLLENYLELYIEKKQHPSKEFKELVSTINNYLEINKNESNNVILALFLNDQGKHKDAISLLKNWNERKPNNTLSQWILDKFNRNKNGDKFQTKFKPNEIKYRIYTETVNLIDLGN